MRARSGRLQAGVVEYLTGNRRSRALYFICRGPTSSHDVPRLRPYSTTRKEHHMSFYDAAVPAYLQILSSLTGILTKAEAHCAAKKIQPDVLLGARLYPDMLPLSQQVQLACDFATKGCARLTHSEVPSIPDTEKTFDELKAAARQDHRLCQGVQAGAVRRRRNPRRDVSDRPRQIHRPEGPAVPLRISRCRTSTSTPPPPTAFCATTASKSASGIFSG